MKEFLLGLLIIVTVIDMIFIYRLLKIESDNDEKRDK